MSTSREALAVVNSDGFFERADHRDPLTDKLYKIFKLVVETGEIGPSALFCFPSLSCWKKEVRGRQGDKFLCVIDGGYGYKDGIRGSSKMGIYQTDEEYCRKLLSGEPTYTSPYYAHFVIMEAPDLNGLFCIIDFEREGIFECLGVASLTELPPQISKRMDSMLLQVLRLMGIP